MFRLLSVRRATGTKRVPVTKQALVSKRATVAALTLALAIPVAGVALAGPAAAASCADAEVIAVRGTSEASPIGQTLLPLTKAIEAGSTKASVSIYGLPYQAAMISYDSPDQGTTMLAQRVNARSKACPKMRFVLLGYSQGSVVIGDALAGKGFGTRPPEIPLSLAPRIAAVVLYADGHFRAGMPYNRGTAVQKNPGVSSSFPRDISDFTPYAKALLEYCNSNDPICQSSPIGVDGHVQYAGYARDAATFVVARLNGLAAPPVSSAPSTPVNTPAPSTDWVSQIRDAICAVVTCT